MGKRSVFIEHVCIAVLFGHNSSQHMLFWLLLDCLGDGNRYYDHNLNQIHFHTGSFSLDLIQITTDALTVTILVSNEAKWFKEFKNIDLVR